MGNETKKIEKIESFIFNDNVQKILMDITNNVMDFNILEITGMGTQEIKHSNLLSWLFDNNEHNLEYEILDEFLKKVLEENESTTQLYHYLYLSDKKRDIKIYREKNDIDLLIVDNSNKILIAIENKLYAKESEYQLNKYERYIDKHYSDFNKYFIFLTINSEKASKNIWMTASHKMIIDILENILEIKEVSEKTKIIFESYIDLMKRNGIVPDEKIKELCEKIWNKKEYSEALDILIDYRVSPLKSAYEKIRSKFDFLDESNYLRLESISKLYSEKLGKNWEDEEDTIFDIILSYNPGKNDYIWLGYHHPDLACQSIEFQEFCNKKIKNKKSNEWDQILKYKKEDVFDKGVDYIIDEISKKVEKIDNEILKELEKN